MPSSKRKVVRPRGSVGRGRNFESRAADFYIQQGYEILERNWQAGHKEIDLIARQGDVVAFIEVKSSHGVAFGHPAEWVTRAKIKKLIAAASQYIVENKIEGCDFRFDVITFEGDKMEHFPNAFQVE